MAERKTGGNSGGPSVAADGYPETEEMEKRANRKARKFIDATPDGNYALRILRAYRYDCDLRWEGQPETEFIRLMNELQDKRTEELDRAIETLQKASVSG